MKLGKAVAIAASVLMAAGLGLSGAAASASAAPAAKTELRLVIEKMPLSVFDAAKVPANELGTCLTALGSKTTTAATRLEWCSSFAGQIQLVNMSTGKIEGTADMAFIDFASWKVSSRTWSPTIQDITETASAKALKDVPFKVEVASTCASGCHVTSNANYSLTVPTKTWAAKKVGVDSPGSAAVTGGLKTTWSFVGVLFSASRTTVGVRCDSRTGYKYKAGCANPGYTPTYNLVSAKYPDIAKFDKAQIAKHPAWATLTRVSATSATANRRVACRGFVRSGPTDSCDEFPYASTSQGGRGAAQEHVKLSENQAQGGNLGGFYAANRLEDGDKFHMKIS